MVCLCGAFNFWNNSGAAPSHGESAVLVSTDPFCMCSLVRHNYLKQYGCWRPIAISKFSPFPFAWIRKNWLQQVHLRKGDDIHNIHMSVGSLLHCYMILTWHATGTNDWQKHTPCTRKIKIFPKCFIFCHVSLSWSRHVTKGCATGWFILEPKTLHFLAPIICLSTTFSISIHWDPREKPTPKPGLKWDDHGRPTNLTRKTDLEHNIQ